MSSIKKNRVWRAKVSLLYKHWRVYYHIDSYPRKAEQLKKLNHLRRSFDMHIIRSIDTSILSIAKPWKEFFKWSRLSMPGVILPHSLFCSRVFISFIRIKKKLFLPVFVFPLPLFKGEAVNLHLRGAKRLSNSTNITTKTILFWFCAFCMLYNTVNIKYKLRSTNVFFLIRYNSKLSRTQNSVRYRGPMVWNVIP